MRCLSILLPALALLAGISNAGEIHAGTGLVSRLSYFSTDDGLNNNFILAIGEDRDGFIWTGTGEGLNRFDGRNFSLPELAPSMPANIHSEMVSSLLAHDDGGFWIGTWGDGVLRYDADTLSITAFRHNPADDASLTDNYVDSLECLPDGRILVGTLQGATILDPVSGQMVRVRTERAAASDSTALNHVRDLLVDAAGTAWIATREGLFRLDPETARATPVEGSHDILRKTILALAENASGLVLGTEDGLWQRNLQGDLARYAPPGMTKDTLAGETITALGTTRDGNLIIGTFTQGGLLEERDRERTRVFSPSTPYPYGMSDAAIVAVHESRDGTIWYGTQSAGLVGISPLSLALEHHAGTVGSDGFLGGRDVTSCEVLAGGDILLGTSEGLMLLSVEDNQFVSDLEAAGWTAPALPSSPIQPLGYTSDGQLWAIGYAEGELLRVDEEQKAVRRLLAAGSGLPQGFLAGLGPAADGAYWLVVYPYSLVHFDPRKGTLQDFPVIDPDDGSPIKLHGFIENLENRQLIETEHGPLELDDSGRFLRWLTGRPRDDVNQTFFEEDGSWWLATRSGALHFDPVGELLETVDASNGLPSDNVVGMKTGPDGTRWFLTSKGVGFRRPGSPLVSLRARHGLQSDVIEGVAFFDSGAVVLAGPNGINIIDTGEVIRAHAYSAPLRISGIDVISANGETVPVAANASNLRLLPDQEHIRINFALLDYTDPRENRYEYRVLGSNDQWTAIGNQSQLILQQVKPGDYVLEVRATSATGVPAANVISLPVVALPHWYESLPAKVFYALLGICPFLLLAWFGLRHTRTRTFLESERNNRRTLEAMYQLTAELAETEDADALASCCLRHLATIHPYEAGAVFSLTNNVPRLLGTRGFDAEQVKVIERLPLTHPRLLATVLHRSEPFRFTAEEAIGRSDIVAVGANWTSLCAIARGGRLAVLLASRTGWDDVLTERMDAVFRQATHALNLDVLREWKPSDNASDPDTGLLSAHGLRLVAPTIDEGQDNFLATFRFKEPVDPVQARRIAWRLVANLRETDMAARACNTVFTVLLRNTSPAVAERVHRRIANSFAEMTTAPTTGTPGCIGTLTAVANGAQVLAMLDEVLT